MITIGILLIFFCTKSCSADISFLNRIKKLIGRETKDKSLKGTFKTVMYLGSEVKISCYGKKSPTNDYIGLSWYHDNKHVSKSKRYTVDKYGVLTIHNASVEDSGDFTCVTKSKDEVHKFRHDVTVLQLPSKSLHVHFMYAVPLCTDKNTEFARRFIQSKVERKVCLQDECKLGYIRSKCQFQEFANPTLKVTVPVLLPSVPTGSCNVKCSREKLKLVKEQVKQKVISAVMIGQRLKIREESQEMSVSQLGTEEDDLCKPGFEMRGSHSRSICVPCSPGHFLEKGYCIPCHLNQFNGKYAAMECQECFGHRVTRSRGSASEGDCYVSDPSVLWIVFLVFVIAIPFIFVCFTWSFVRVTGQSLARGFHSLYSCTHSKSGKGKRSLNPIGNKSKEALETGAKSASSIPSVRHSTAKDFFYKDPQTVPRYIPPPPLPSGPEPAKTSRRIEPTPGDAKHLENDASGVKNSVRKNLENIFPKSGIDPLSHYSDRVLKNPAMYNAIKKSFA